MMPNLKIVDRLDGVSPIEKKKDLSEVKYFSCYKFGHYAFQCPQKKRTWKHHASTIIVDPLQKKTKLDKIVDEP